MPTRLQTCRVWLAREVAHRGVQHVVPWPAEPDAVARSNRDTIARFGLIQACALGAVPRPDAALLAAAGAALGVDQLIG
jgi:hypothetical protein